MMEPVAFEIYDIVLYWFKEMVKLDGSPFVICSNDRKSVEMINEADFTITQSSGLLDDALKKLKKFEGTDYFTGLNPNTKMAVININDLAVLKYIDFAIGSPIDIDTFQINSKNYMMIFIVNFPNYKGYMIEMTDYLPSTSCSIANCKKCHGQKCDLCDDNYYYHQNTCVASCPLTHKIEIPKTRKGNARCSNNCSDISFGCNNCDNKGKCLSCSTSVSIKDFKNIQQTGLKLFSNSCVLSCPADTSEISYQDNTGVHCLICDPSCKTCQTELDSGCLTCQEGLKFKLGFCVSECGQGHYHNSTSNTCESCSIDCIECEYQDSSPGKEVCVVEREKFNLLNKLYFSGSYSVLLIFDDKIDKNTDLSLFTATLNINNNNIKILSVKNYDDSSLQIFLDLEEQANKNDYQNISIFYDNNTTKTLINNNKIFNQFPIILQIPLYSTPIQKYFSKNPTTIKSAVSFIILFFISNLKMSAHLHKFIASLRFLGLINIKLPIMVTELTKNLDLIEHSLLNKIMNSEEIESSCTLKPKFKENNIHCFALNNVKNEYFIIIILITVLIIFKIFQFFSSKLIKSSSSYIKIICQKINSIYDTSLVLSVITNFRLKIVLGSLAFFNSSFSSSSKIFSIFGLTSYLLIVLMVLYFVFQTIALMLLVYQGIYTSKNQKKINFRLRMIREIGEIIKKNLKENCNGVTLLYIEYSMFKDYIIPILLIFCQEYPKIQLLFCLLLYSFDMIFLILEKPFLTLKVNIVDIFNSLIYSLILVTFWGVYLSEKYINPSQKENYFGYLILSLLVIGLLGNIMLSATLTLFSYIRLCIGKSKNKIQGKQIIEEEEDNQLDCSPFDEKCNLRKKRHKKQKNRAKKNHKKLEISKLGKSKPKVKKHKKRKEHQMNKVLINSRSSKFIQSDCFKKNE